MKYKVSTIIYKSFFLVVMVLVANTVAMAQFGDGPGTPCEGLPPDACDPDNEVPIDGGASILIAAGVAYGVKKIHDKRKAKAQEEMI